MKISKIFKGLVVLGALGLLTACSDGKAAVSKKLTGESLAKIQADNKEKEKYLVIDVRSPEEYAQGHLKHAINIPTSEIANRLDELDGYQDKNVVVYCYASGSSSKSSKAQKILQDKGFKNVILAQGLKEYNYDLFKFGSINAAQFLKIALNPDVLIIDVRKKEDYEKAHMKGAINIPDGEPVANYKDVLEANKDKKIVAHCYSGNRSAKLVEALQKEGYKTLNLLDGTKEYKYELVK